MLINICRLILCKSIFVNVDRDSGLDKKFDRDSGFCRRVNRNSGFCKG